MADALGEAFGVYSPDEPPLSPAAAPFLLLETGERTPEEIVRSAREQGVAIRDATTFRGLDSHVRVAVRNPDENDRLLEVLLDGRGGE
jgi:histidinol-phosphate/aromatic aminotransferase/cobyric acid decarboxylase-like protein